MIVLEGLPALSPFRRERLELRLQSVSPGVRIAGAWHVYWIDPEPGASPDPAVLRRNVTSPNGTTAAGLAVLMEEGTGLTPLMVRTVAAATERGRELGRG